MSIRFFLKHFPTLSRLNVLLGIVSLFIFFSMPLIAANMQSENPATPRIDIIKPDKFVQGSSFIVTVQADTVLQNPVLSFNGQTFPLYKQADASYRGVGAVDALQKQGGYTLKLKDDSGKLSYSEVIEVYPGGFPVQNIVIRGSKAGLQATQKELAAIGKAKKNISDTSYWSTLPFIQPTSGCVISVYGLNRYHNGVNTGDYHKGQDIKAPQGNKIVATTAGKILIADSFNLHGKTVAIDHGQGLMSIYIHMSKIDVKEGDMVSAGEKIGEVGSTGFATGPHLHWGLYVYGTPVNPDDWVGRIRRCG